MVRRLALVVAMTSIALAGCGAVSMLPTTPGAAAAGPASGGPSITVQGEAKVPVTDSTATFDVGVQEQATTAAQALSQDNTTMNAVIAALKKQGATATDLTTQNLSVYPQYTGGGPNEPPRITGWQADDTLSVKVADATKVGPFVDAAVAAGANQLNSVTFGPPDGDALTQQALAAAVDNARARAAAIAKAANLTLGPVTAVTTQVQAPPVRTYSLQAMAPLASSATPVLTGNQQLTADVTVTFQAS